MIRAAGLRREALISAAAAATVAALLAWLGPPGTDLAAHAYQRTIFLQHGFSLWNNFWYAGRYSFVTYSLLYYPLAALLGIRLLAVATIATAAYAFAVVLGREWGPAARWSSRTFAVIWAGIVLSAAFPFALGMALALLGIWSLQARAHWRFALLAALTLAASPVAFLLLVVVVSGIALSRRTSVRSRNSIVPAAALAMSALFEFALTRAFPGGGRFPFSFTAAVVCFAFCLVGLAFTWRVESLRVLRFVFGLYLVACILAFAVPSTVGENIGRLRYAAVPLAVLVFSVRRWRPLVPALIVVTLAILWNVAPLAESYAKGEADPAAQAAYWAPAVNYLEQHLTPSYRVEAVDTAGHWPAVYLADVGIPLARGWFRQDDFPQNEVLYGTLGPRAYMVWLRNLGVRYVVLTGAPPDYSARGEAALLKSERSGLKPVFVTRALTIYQVPRARPILTGPGSPRVAALRQTRVDLIVRRPGRFHLAVRWSPYWHASRGCLTESKDGMISLRTRRATPVSLRFDVSPKRALAALAGEKPTCA
ncbi:MAG: hypothetical protein ABR569_01580 [Gaiellaceae bacterium]